MLSTKHQGIAITAAGIGSFVIFETTYGAAVFLIAGLVLVAVGFVTTYSAFVLQ